MPTDEGPRLRRSHYAALGVAGIVIATVFAFVASLTVRPADHVQPLPDLPGPVIGDSSTTSDPAPATTTAKPAGKPPVATFRYTCNGSDCTFNDAGSQGAIVRWTWSFGDRGGADGPNLRQTSHSYRDSGRYLVTLTVTDGDGRTARGGATITIP
jgi:hypothetical protein